MNHPVRTPFRSNVLATRAICDSVNRTVVGLLAIIALASPASAFDPSLCDAQPCVADDFESNDLANDELIFSDPVLAFLMIGGPYATESSSGSVGVDLAYRLDTIPNGFGLDSQANSTVDPAVAIQTGYVASVEIGPISTVGGAGLLFSGGSGGYVFACSLVGCQFSRFASGGGPTILTQVALTLDPAARYQFVMSRSGVSSDTHDLLVRDLTNGGTLLYNQTIIDATYDFSGVLGMLIDGNGNDAAIFAEFDDFFVSDGTSDSDGDTLDDRAELMVLYTDPLDTDSDGDGLTDDIETNTGTYVNPSDRGTDPNDPDSDGDGLTDDIETGTGVWVSPSDRGTDPNNLDSDGDGLLDSFETNNGIFTSIFSTGTNPNEPHSDSDSLSDGEEVLGTAFVTSTTQDGDLGGLAGADAICESLASAAGIGAGYRAWLSTSTVDARDRIVDGPYVRTDGALVAFGTTDLTDGTLFNPISLDESALPVSSEVWTGTSQAGQATSDTCLDWQSSGENIGSFGASLSSDSNWTENFAGLCLLPIRSHYCFGGRFTNPLLPDTDGDGLNDDVETNTGVYASAFDTGSDPNNPDSDGDGLGDDVETNTGTYASASDAGTNPNLADSDGDGLSDGSERPDGTVFVTSTAHLGDFGSLLDADALCQARADTARLGGGFSAWLSTTTIDARDRIGDVPYRRTDGALLATGRSDLVDGSLSVPLSYDESAVETPGGSFAWTGTLADGTFDAVNGSCGDWASGASTGAVGVPTLSNAAWTNVGTPIPCGVNAARLYCFAPARGFASDPTKLDSDGDGLDDDVETDTDSFVDENDTGTNALNPDSDGDGLDDGEEVAAGTDPNDVGDFPMTPPAVPMQGALGYVVLMSLLTGIGMLLYPRSAGRTAGRR